MKLRWTVLEDGREPTPCASLYEAQQHVEDRAVEIWDALRDPNDPAPQNYPGLHWSHRHDHREDGSAIVVRVAMLREKPETEWEVHYVA